jgi:hypothetical protein
VIHVVCHTHIHTYVVHTRMAILCGCYHRVAGRHHPLNCPAVSVCCGTFTILAISELKHKDNPVFLVLQQLYSTVCSQGTSCLFSGLCPQLLIMQDTAPVDACRRHGRFLHNINCFETCVRPPSVSAQSDHGLTLLVFNSRVHNGHPSHVPEGCQALSSQPLVTWSSFNFSSYPVVSKSHQLS